MSHLEGREMSVPPQVAPLDDRRARGRRVFGIALELLFAIVLVLSCFSIFLVILARSFPRGTRLGDVLTTEARREDGNAAARTVCSAMCAKCGPSGAV